MKYFDEDLDEIIMQRNTRGGKPQKIGASLLMSLQAADSCIEITQIQEETQVRYHLGYCSCGKKIVVGNKRAAVLMRALERQGVEPIPKVDPVRMRLARYLAAGGL